MAWLAPESVLALGPDGQTLVCALTKRTYEVARDGRVRICEEQYLLDTSADTPPPDTFDDSWKAELDAAPYKIGTDVVVFGRAHAPQVGCTQMMVELQIPNRNIHSKLVVTGDRICEYRAARDPSISPPQPFETMPIGYDRAYGGVDPFVEFPRPAEHIEEALSMIVQPAGIYPRNPVGRGYAVHNRPELIDGLRLPNVERPEQRLRTEQILVKDPRQWWRQPLPAGFGWFDVSWFPRCVFAGGLPFFPAPANVAEVKLGFLPPDFQAQFETPDGEAPRLDHRLFSAASPGLTLPYLRGDEALLTTGMCAEARFNIRLPADRPDLRILYRNRQLPVDLVPHTVALLPEERRFFVVWRASAVVPDPESLDPEAFQVGIV